MDLYTVYKHTSPSGKVYIGVTKREPKERWKYGHGYKHNAYFQNAIRKYGWNNIDHEIIAQNLTVEEASRLEKELIAQYTVLGICYNIAEGGIDGNTWKRSEEEKKRLREYFKEYYKTHPSPLKGKHHSEEALEIMRIKGKKRWKDNYELMYAKVVKKVPIGVYNILSQDYKEFSTEKDAAKVLNVEESTLRRHVNDGSLLNDYLFFPLDKYTFEEALKRTYDRENLGIHCGGQEIEVVQLDLEGNYINTYTCAKQASIETKTNISCLRKACTGDLKHANGYFWMYKPKYLQYAAEGILKNVLNAMKANLSHRKEVCTIPILQLSLEDSPIQVFRSTCEIHRELEFDNSIISKCCRGVLSKAYNYKWKRITKEEYEYYKELLVA